MPSTSIDFTLIPVTKYDRIKELFHAKKFKQLDMIYRSHNAYPPDWPKCRTCDKSIMIEAWTNYAIKKGII